jgi:hypothetical protein
MAECPSCGEQLEPEARFCASCGAAVPPPARFCWACGGELEVGALFCGLCGSQTDGPPEDDPTVGLPADGAATTAAMGIPDEARTLAMPAAASPPPYLPPPAYLPPQPPPVASGDQSGGRRGLSAGVIVLAIFVALVVAGAALAVVLITRDHKPTGSTSATGGASPAHTTPASPQTSSSSPASPSTDPSSASPSPSPSPTGLSQADKDEITASLQTYFDGINAGDYQASWNRFTPRMRKKVPLAKFAEGDSTSQDSNVVYHWIKKKGPATAIVYVTFTSTQDAAYGPNGDTVDNWTLEYTMKLVGGQWLIDGSAAHNGSKYTPG